VLSRWENLVADHLRPQGLLGRLSISDVLFAICSIHEMAPWQMLVVSKNLTAPAGTYTAYFTVPRNERWIIRYLSREASIGATVIRLRNDAGTAIPLSSSAGSRLSIPGAWGGAASIPAFQYLVLGPGWDLGMDTTGDAGDTSIDMELLFQIFPA